MPETLKIFLASSSELKEDREEFEKFISRKNKELVKRDQFIELVIWEDFIDAMSRTRLQDEYNRAARECDVFVMLFWTKVGPYTREEFETAFGQFQETNKPKIYVYFKTSPVSLSNIPSDDILSLLDFQKRLQALGHFPTKYSNSAELINHFNAQLDKLGDKIKIVEPQLDEAIIKKYWQQLIQDSDFNSMPVIGKRDRQRLENLYVRLQVTAHGDKTAVRERFLECIPDKKGRSDELIQREMPPWVAINLFQRFVVLGAPGMGKTTMFRYIAYTVSRLGLGLARADEFALEKKSNLIPLYLPLNELMGSQDDLVSCLKNYVNKRFPGCKALLPLLDALLKNGQCLILLDSLDEVPVAFLRQVKETIKGFLNNIDWKDNIVLLSCREASWKKDEVGLEFPAVLQIADLDAPAIGEYLLRWFGPEASAEALELKEKICNTPRLKMLATNPFLLSLIAWLSKEKELPERRVELYGKCIEALLKEKHRDEHDRFPTRFGEDHAEYKFKVLIDVGFEMMRRNLIEIERKELRGIIRDSLGSSDDMDERPGQLIDEIHKGSAILRETNAEHVYMFQHNTFREYFAAKKLKDLLEPILEQQNYSDLIRNHPSKPLQWIKEPLWTEVYRLTVGLMDNPTPALELLFDLDPTLAARCYLDAHSQKVDHAVIRQRWTKRIDRTERIRIVQGIKESIKDTREMLDFIAGIFLTGETDTEVLYYCDELLHSIDTPEAKQLSQRMFDQWPKERQFKTHAKAFEKDQYWKWVEIKAGEFKMGSNEDDDEKPIHPVKISSFLMARYPVTIAQYLRFDPDHRKRYQKDYARFFKDENQPVILVSWYDAYIFCKWANGRLPTEAEWEYACPAGTTTAFNTGDNLTTDQANYDGNYPYKNYPKGKYLRRTTPVGSYPPNAWGLYDMHGNVWEWCSDWYDDEYYAKCKKQGLVENPKGPDAGSRRVLRGGSWNCIAVICRSAYRTYDTPDFRSYIWLPPGVRPAGQWRVIRPFP